jgi:hypothetical protein
MITLTGESELERDEISILVYRDGKVSQINRHETVYVKLLEECDRLLGTVDSIHRLIVSKGHIEKVKRGSALEIIFPNVKEVIIPFNGRKLYYTRLIIPLDGGFSKSTIFFSGMFDYPKKPTVLEYDNIAEGLGALINSKGFDALRNVLGL